MKFLNTNAKTTYTESYVKYDDRYIKAPDFARSSKVDKPLPAPPPRTILDLETLARIKKQIPISLMSAPDKIVNENPHEPIKHYVLPEDTTREEVIKTRPRIYNRPQISLDNITDTEMRKLILNYTYTTDFRKAEEELLSMVGIEHRIIPESVIEHQKFLDSGVKAYFNVALKPDSILTPKMSEEQNFRGKEWTNQQISGISNATEHFWKKKKVHYENPSDILDHESKENIAKLVREDNLRVPFDVTCQGYSGFKPEIASGDAAKLKLPQTHPLLSTYQASFN